ncbi:hypothetical protein FSARC_3018 [Fusarium sarcochroum]|uniref:YCII-related domain-containing protein n=1 Tax=Fusarium sarcochroum TaxID=1208366 RepID=A0A8H4XD04_9HYPO|nr:hypothetical protein FSARC_3018 [Fusarium sarcochroum]
MASRIAPKRLITPILSRAFSVAAPPQKPYFLVIIPDKPGSASLRTENESPRQAAYGGNIVGSCVIWSAESKEEVLETLRKDVYVEKGVWDFGKNSEFRES